MNHLRSIKLIQRYHLEMFWQYISIIYDIKKNKIKQNWLEELNNTHKNGILMTKSILLELENYLRD